MCDGYSYSYNWLAGYVMGFFPLIHARILVLFEGGRICINRWVMMDNLWGVMMSLVLQFCIRYYDYYFFFVAKNI